MPLARLAVPFDHPDWVFELKYDGFRALAHIDGAGRPQFYSLLRRRAPQQFVAFDILWLDGRDVRGLSLLERKRLLRQVVPVGGPVLYADYVRERGVELFRAVCDERPRGHRREANHGPVFAGNDHLPTARRWVATRCSRGAGRQERDLFG